MCGCVCVYVFVWVLFVVPLVVVVDVLVFEFSSAIELLSLQLYTSPSSLPMSKLECDESYAGNANE